MNRWYKLCLLLGIALITTRGYAQINGNLLMPPPINMTQSGWNTTLQEGNLTFGLPLASVPGEVPIPVAFGLNATYLASSWVTKVYDPDIGKSVPVFNEIDRPMVGGVHFGYISAPSTYSGSTVPGLTVLESGVQIADIQWSAFSSNSTLGTTLNLPQAFGFTAVSPSVAMVDPTATYLTYSTTLSGINPTYQNAISTNLPSGFGTASTSYKVVMDKNRARVYAWGASVNAWVPVLWVDRFGHYVTFQWVRSTAGLPTGVTAITKVTATNQRSKGVVLRWANYASNAAPAVDILRVDYVGIHAPSVLVQGYPGYSGLAPAAFVDPYGADNQWTVVPSVIGSSCRPTTIIVGAYGSVSQPSWSGYAGLTAAIAPGAPPADGTADSATRTWSFTYDANLAELTSFTDPRQLTTSFLYTNYVTQTGLGGKCQPRGVSEVHAVDAASKAQWMRWTRTFTTTTTPTTLTIKAEGWWDPNQMPSPDRYHSITFPTDALNYGNGVYQTDTLVDTTGKTSGSTTTYAYNAVGAGLNASLSSVQSMTVQQDGAPTMTAALGYPDATKLQVTQQNVSATDATGKVYQVSQTISTYGTRWDMLEGHQLTQVATTRYSPDGVTSLGTVTQKNVYDAPASGPALLQLQKSYLDGGTTGQHGLSYSYDSQGRFSSQIVYHVEGTQAIQAPSFRLVGYDAATGSMVSDAVVDQTVTPATSLAKTMGGFDSAGRPTTVTDPSGVTTTYTYDDRGRVLSVSRLGSPSVSYAYPNEWTVQSTTNGLTTYTYYDGLGRVTQISRPTGLPAGGGVAYTIQTPTYDAYSRRFNLKEVNPAGTVRSQSWFYDALDRVTGQTSYTGNVTALTYGVSGINSTQTSTYTSSLGSTIQTVTKKDPFGQAVEADAPNGSTTVATYDAFGHQAQVILTDVNSNQQLRSWTYDGLGRLTSKTEPETNTQTFSSYTALNQPGQVTEAPGTLDPRTRVLSYDGFGRLLSMVNGADNVAYTYTGPNLTSSSRSSGGQTVSQSFVYNGVGGRLSSESTTQPGFSSIVSYGYDPLGRLTTLTYPDNRTVGYGYDSLSRASSIFQVNSYIYNASSGVTTITQNGPAIVSNITFDDWGNRWQTQFASGAQDQWDADLTGTLLKQWSIGYVGGGPDIRGYVYDSATNILAAAGEWTTLKHDAMGHLMEADGFGIKTVHNTDAFGNEIYHQVTADPNPVPPAFNNFTFNPLANNQIPGQESNGALTGWNTNARGEATQVGGVTASSTVLGLGWDGLGVLRSVAWNAGNQTFLYAPSGMRVSLTDTVNSANNRKYAYTTGGLLLGEYVSNGTPSWNRDVVYLGSQAVAEINAAGVHELHSDHLGSPRLITKGAGTWASSYNGTIEGKQAYGPYGELIGDSGFVPPPGFTAYVPLTGYSGHIQTDTSGLIYMRGRYYSPAWHAFVNSDQGVDPSTWNQRAYVGGSPFMRADPSGMTAAQFSCVDGALVMTVGSSSYFVGVCSGGGGAGGDGTNSLGVASGSQVGVNSNGNVVVYNPNGSSASIFPGSNFGNGSMGVTVGNASFFYTGYNSGVGSLDYYDVVWSSSSSSVMDSLSKGVYFGNTIIGITGEAASKYGWSGKFGAIAKDFGPLGNAIGNTVDVVNYLNGDISGEHLAVNTGVNITAAFVGVAVSGPLGIGIAGVYGAVDSFYPGGWSGLYQDAMSRPYVGDPNKYIIIGHNY